MSESNPLAELEAQLGFSAEESAQVSAQPAKRGRGRPAGSTNGATPNRRGSINLTTVKGQLVKGLEMANAVFVLTAPRYAVLKLSDEEIPPLADALALEINASPKLQNLMQKAGAISPHLALASALAGIVFTRMALLSQIPAQVPPQPHVDSPDTFTTPAEPVYTNGHTPGPVSTPIVEPALNDAGQPIVTRPMWRG